MQPMTRHLLAVIGGLAAGGVVIATAEGVGHAFYPPPPELLNLAPGEPITAEMTANVSFESRVAVLLAWGLGALVGGGIAGWVARESWTRAALIVGLLFLAAAILNLMAIPSPGWFWAVALVEFVPAAYLGGRIGAWRYVSRRRRESASAPRSEPRSGETAGRADEPSDG